MSGYVVLFLAACAILFIGVPLCSRLEDRADERDREAFSRFVGGQR